MVRKNRHPYQDPSETCDDGVMIGVDLNRNYGFEFAHDDEGSNSDQCNQNYRGPRAFSEPETQAMRNLVLRFDNIKVAVNMHAHDSGGLFITPFNFDTAENRALTLSTKF